MAYNLLNEYFILWGKIVGLIGFALFLIGLDLALRFARKWRKAKIEKENEENKVFLKILKKMKNL